MILQFMFQGHSELRWEDPGLLKGLYILITINSSLASHLVDNSFIQFEYYIKMKFLHRKGYRYLHIYHYFRTPG